MIRHAETEDLIQIKKLWTEAFEDGSTYAEEFFEQNFYSEYALCEEEEGKIRAVLYKIPCIIIKEEGPPEKGCYFYALTTGKEFCRQGIMGRLLEFGLKELQSEGGTAAFLVPENGQLMDYYRKFGFEYWERLEKWDERREKNVWLPVNIEEFWKEWAGKVTYGSLYVGSTVKLGPLYGYIPL